MGPGKYLSLVLKTAFRSAIDITQWCLFALFLAGGMVHLVARNEAAVLSHQFMTAIVSWEGAAILFGSVVAARLIAAPYLIWRDDQEKVAAVASSSPRVRAEVVSGPQKHALYTKTQFWGIRIHNDGTAATFQATIRVTEDRSTSLQYQPDDSVLGWGDTRDSQKELLNGAYCDLLFCAVERVNPTMPHQQDRIWVTGGPANSPRTVWESMAIVGETDEPYATLAISIYSKPAMIGGPLRLTLRLDRTGLKVLPDPNTAKRFQQESVS